MVNYVSILFFLGKWQSTAEHSLCTEVVGGCEQVGRGFMGTGRSRSGRVIGTQQTQQTLTGDIPMMDVGSASSPTVSFSMLK